MAAFPRPVNDLHRVHAELLARMRTDRAAGVLVEDEDRDRRRGVLAAYDWLTNPRSDVGPMSDGPASSADRVERELRSAYDVIRADARRGGRPGSAACRAIGVAQLLAYALGYREDSVLEWPQAPRGVAAA
jgi:hypothetical protein